MLLENLPKDEKFENAPPILGGAPVEDDEALRNIRETFDFDLPVLEKGRETRDDPCIFVAGGPTLRQYLDEIRSRKAAGAYILTSNNTHDFLVDNGIIPNACLILDPKEVVMNYIQKPQVETIYYLATVVNKAVIGKLLGYKCVKVLIAYGMPKDADITLQSQLYKRGAKDFLVGGTMTPLRAMPLATMLGFKKIEFYGFDSCFGSQEPDVVKKGDPRFETIKEANGGMFYLDSETKEEYVLAEPEKGGFFYAYKKRRAENITIIKTPDDRTWLTSPGFANQARQITKWVDRLEGKLEVVIHGDSLSSHLLKLHRENAARNKVLIGDRRWTEEYAAMQREMHTQGNYGLWGAHDISTVGRGLLTLYDTMKRPLTILDYGCGSGALASLVEEVFNIANVTRYDPFHPKWGGDRPVAIHDVVTCCDVMEHVEPQCVDNTLRYISERCRYMGLFYIATEEAEKTLPDGRNAHICLRGPKWWVGRLTDHGFVTTEIMMGMTGCFFVCQKVDAKEVLTNERLRKEPL